jgi:hypothetical protein
VGGYRHIGEEKKWGGLAAEDRARLWVRFHVGAMVGSDAGLLGGEVGAGWGFSANLSLDA